MIDEHKLLEYSIPSRQQRVTPRDVVLYALSVGLGQDPLDERQLAYVDARRPLSVMPSMAVVVGHPGFWLGNPATGVNALKLVHGEQSIVLHGRLPIDGTISAKTRVTGLVDKGAEKGALLYTEKEVHDQDGRLLAVTSSTTFLRGDGGFGGAAGPVKPVYPIPDSSPEFILETPTRPEQALLYRLNGDDNPLHADPAVAAKAGFQRPILHGLCTFGVVTHALLRVLGNYQADAFRSLALRFSAPVYPGETIRTEIWRNGAFRARVVERDLIVVNNGLAVFS